MSLSANGSEGQIIHRTSTSNQKQQLPECIEPKDVHKNLSNLQFVFLIRSRRNNETLLMTSANRLYSAHEEVFKRISVFD